MKQKSIQKQISIFLPLSDWKALRLEAAKQRIPITELCRRWIRPGLLELQKRNQQDSWHLTIMDLKQPIRNGFTSE